MSKFSRYLFLLVIGNVLWISGCGAGNPAAPTQASAPIQASSSQTYTVVAISDIHFNPLANPALFPKLLDSPASGWQSIFEADTSTPVSTFGTDTDYPSLVLALAALKQNLGSSPVIIFSGDMLGHDLPQCFYQLFAAKFFTANPIPTQLNPADCPLPPTTTPSQGETGAMQEFLDNTLAFVCMQIRANVGTVPVIFVPGNIDTYDSAGTGPDALFLANNAATYYTYLLNESVDKAPFDETFTSLGSYTAQPLGSNLMVIALDSNPFAQSPNSPPLDSLDPYAELAWLDSQLAAAQLAGQKVWLIMHVPPGANTTVTAQKVGTFNSSTQIADDEAAMMWQPQYQILFMQILSKYPGLIAMGITGHTHMDEFRVLPTGDVLFGIPGISPVFGNNPAFKIFTFWSDTEVPLDYQSISYNLAASPAPTQFNTLYTFSTAYAAAFSTPYVAAPNATLESSVQQLYPQLTPTAPVTATFINYYVSSSTTFPWNMANTANWPIFSCGLSQMDEPDYVDCVNSY